MPFVINAGDAPVSLWSRHARHFTIITPYSPPIKTGPREKNLLYTTDWVFGSYYWGELNVCSRKTICSLSSFTTSINCIVFLWLAVTAARKLLLVLVPCVIKNNIEVTSSKKVLIKKIWCLYTSICTWHVSQKAVFAEEVVPFLRCQSQSLGQH